MRYKLCLRYDGSAYHGWQIQSNADTVQKRLNDALSRIFNEDIRTVGCSRTDAGVHALKYICHFDSARLFDTVKLPNAVNAYLPIDIRVISAENVSDDFHARFSVIDKTYKYLVYSFSVFDPFYNKKACHINYDLNVDFLNRLAKDFIGVHDFTAFMAQGSPISDPHREIYSFDVTKKDNLIVFEVKGNGFLYNQVRIMCGTLIDIARGKIKNSIPDIISSNDRTKAGKTLPPDGLYLYEINF